MREFVEKALRNWRFKRDEAFTEHGLNISEVYANGEFESLPAPCLMAVCYVDAYASMQAMLNDLEEAAQRYENGKLPPSPPPQVVVG